MVGAAAQRTWRIAPANLLIRTQKGWTSWQRGSARPLDPAVGAELDHLLSLPAFWREQAFAEVADCSSGARVAVIRHRARLRIDRQPCVPKGLRGRLAELAASERLPRGSKPFPADAQEWNRWTLTNEDSETIFELTNQSAWAWQRGELEIHLAPYAEDVTMVWPTGIEEGKEALRRRARAAQTWSKQYNPRELGVRLQKLHQAGPLSALQTSNFFFVGGDKPPTHYWVTSLWYKRRGEWEIVYEQVGAEMPDRLR
jgi:ketosteroid isomerase-like protein